MVHPLTPIFLKPCLCPQQLSLLLILFHRLLYVPILFLYLILSVPLVYISVSDLWPWYQLCIPNFLTSYIVADTVGTPQLDLWGLPLCQVCSLSSLFHVYGIELRITIVSVCHICSACPCLRVSLYMSGLISVLPSQQPGSMISK